MASPLRIARTDPCAHTAPPLWWWALTRSDAKTHLRTEPSHTRAPTTLQTHNIPVGSHNQHAQTCVCPHTYPHMQTHPSQTLKATIAHVVKGPQICAQILYTHAPTDYSHPTARRNAITNMHIPVGAHTPPDTYGHTHFTHKRTHTRGRTQLTLTRALTWLSPHPTSHMETSKTHTRMARYTPHTSAQTHCTHTMHTHFTHKWEHAASFSSICFKAGALSCVGRVCVRMSEFFKFITHSLHDIPGFITILLFPWQVVPLLRNSRVITP